MEFRKFVYDNSFTNVRFYKNKNRVAVTRRFKSFQYLPWIVVLSKYLLIGAAPVGRR